MPKSLTYADAGVDIDKANRFVDTIKKIANKTRRPGVMGEIGGFGGLFSLNMANLENPVLVSSTDGVGTKLKIAFMMDVHNTIGIDLVAMCVNDIVVQGAKPLFFLDYLSMGKLDTTVATQIVTGISAGCQKAGCALIGGETAEMPGMYAKGEYDLAGFSVGIVDNQKIIDGSGIRPGHRLVGIASSGLHSNGYSLVRKICFDKLGLNVSARVAELEKTIGETLLTPTKIYAQSVTQLMRSGILHGVAHITGGGIQENLVRVVPDSLSAVIEAGSWPVLPVFDFLQQAGNVSDIEMQRTFNNGIGMILVVPEEATQDTLDQLTGLGENAYLIGEIRQPKKGDPRVAWS